eukprot:2258307-Lingulodinium_polyedra.AAC.1
MSFNCFTNRPRIALSTTLYNRYSTRRLVIRASVSPSPAPSGGLGWSTSPPTLVHVTRGSSVVANAPYSAR